METAILKIQGPSQQADKYSLSSLCYAQKHLSPAQLGSWLATATCYVLRFSVVTKLNSSRLREPVIDGLDILSGSSSAVNISLHMI